MHTPITPYRALRFTPVSVARVSNVPGAGGPEWVSSGDGLLRWASACHPGRRIHRVDFDSSRSTPQRLCAETPSCTSQTSIIAGSEPRPA